MGRYRLTEKGQIASELLKKFPEKRAEPKPLTMGDALLVGIAGFLMLFAFPLIYLPLAGFLGSFLLVTIYELLVPGGVMWWLTVRRAKSHDFYDLLKPPLIPMSLIIGWIILMTLLDVSFSITLAMRSDSGQVQFGMMGFMGFLVLGFFPFIGVVIAESLHRLLKFK